METTTETLPALMPAREHDLSTAVQAMQDVKFKIPGDIVNRATSTLPDDQRSAIRWLHAYGAENNLTLAELGHIVRYDASTLHRVFHGKYEGNLANVCKEITEGLRLAEARNKGKKLEFITTALARRIWKYCDACLEFQRIGYIFGESQIGKTVALLKYQQDHNHGSTIYVRMTAGGATTNFLAVLARALRISPQQREKDLIRRIIEAFDDRMLLIVDEVHQCCLRSSILIGGRTIEFIRELFDLTGCGVVLIGTPVFEEEMESGRFAKLLQQIKRRRLPKLKLPSTPSADDLNIFAKAYGLTPAEGEFADLQKEVLRDEALGMWLTILRMAAKLAAKQKKSLAWPHVRAAYNFLRTYESNS